ncbi:hypothetical protein F4803DRAFT_534966 [Xylaria telfairii]|nr:hypothetical protein F4803DRAFT_534966 [Xylaria telfairii]
MHSSVSVFQLGAILLVSIIRAGLRTQRLGKDLNLLRNRPDEVEGHELDWLALQMAKDKPEEQGQETKFWSVTSGLEELQPPPHDDGGNTGTKSQPKDTSEVFFYRSRLAELTSQPTRVKSKSSAAWDERLVYVRQQARQLKQAIESSADVLFTHGKVKSGRKRLESVPWAIKVVENDGPKQEVVSKVYLSLHKGNRNEESTTWEVNQHDLEAVCGLWAWSIISDPQTEQTDKFGLWVSEASEVPVSRIIASGNTKEEIERHAETELQLWVDTPWSTSIKEWKPEAQRMHRDILWETQDSEVSNTYHIRPSPQLKRLRLHGWQIVPDDPKTATFILTTTARNSISTLCAHDVYQSFLCAAIQVLDTIGGETKALKGNRRILFTNEVVTQLAECFKESGLGSIHDAFLVIIPALQCRSMLPLPENAIQSIYIRAENSRKEGDFRDAEDLLRWAWQSMWELQNDYLLVTGMLELGELYRDALFRKNEVPSDFAHKGISWMKDIIHNKPPDHPAAIIAARYATLEEMSKKRLTTEVNAQQVINAIVGDNRLEAMLLISYVKQVQIADNDGRTILSWAAQRGWQEIVKTAVDIGSVIDDRDSSKRTALSYAAEHGHAPVVKILMEKGALPFAEDSSRRTPLSYAAGGGHDHVLEVLLEDHRVTVFTSDQNQQSALHWAAKNGQCGAIELLLQHGAKATLAETNSQGHSALIVALLSRRLAAAELLITNGAQFDISIDQMDAWKWAVQNGEWTCAACLLRHLNRTREERRVVITIAPDHHQPKGNGCSASKSIPPEIMVYALADDGTQTEITMETVVDVVAGQYSMKVELYEQGDWVSKHDSLRISLLTNWRQAYRAMPSMGRNNFPHYLLQMSDRKIDESMTSRIAGLLLDQLGKEVKLTKEVIQAAARNGAEVMNVLLDQRGEEINVTEMVLEMAGRNRWTPSCFGLTYAGGTKIVCLLLDGRGTVEITDELVKKVLEGFSERAIDILLDRRGGRLRLRQSF